MPDLDLVELTVRITCDCGEWFYHNEFDEINTCFRCKAQYKVYTEFKRFEIEKV